MGALGLRPGTASGQRGRYTARLLDMRLRTMLLSEAIVSARVWVVILVDGFGKMSHLRVFSFEHDYRAVEAWARKKLADERSHFPSNLNNRSLPQSFTIYGEDVSELAPP